MTTNKRIKQQGAVSLFIVIFAALLMTIVTVGFVQLMIKDQQQATTSDLSQSAYDSSLAGVEDAKRLLILDQACRDGTAGSGVNCAKVTAALTPVAGTNETKCDTLPSSGIVGSTNGETIIQKATTGDATSKQLDQAYTCVKIATNTDDYKAQLALNQSSVIPLRGVSDFDSVKISWFSKVDLPDPNSTTLTYGDVGKVTLPPIGDAWQFNRPSLIRAQLMQTGTNFTQGDFNDGRNGGSDNNTLFLYPAFIGGLNNLSFAALDGRRNPANTPHLAACEADLNSEEYACSVTLTLPPPNDGNVATRNAYLHLNALYNSAHYKIQLTKANLPVQFAGVQPIVDSTGRANDAFRRVQARVELKSEFTYPEAAIDVEGDLCKNFTITDSDAGYDNSPTCTP